MRRKPDFDRFTAGLRNRVNGWLNDPDYTPQDLTNIVRSELARIWKHLIEKISKQEHEIKSLKSENAALKEKLAKSVECLEMVEDNSKMPHQHSDYYTRLCCLSERARQTLEEIKG